MATYNTLSSNGRTIDFGSMNCGSNPQRVTMKKEIKKCECQTQFDDLLSGRSGNLKKMGKIARLYDAHTAAGIVQK